MSAATPADEALTPEDEASVTNRWWAQMALRGLLHQKLLLMIFRSTDRISVKVDWTRGARGD